MAFSLQWSTRLALCAIFILALCQHAAAVVQYCSDINTASMGKNSSIYQSNGLCRDFCVERNTAFAIVQFDGCWCSDYAPGDTSSGDCDQSCPGYPSELCGNSDNGLYGYVALGQAPSGTSGGASVPTSTKAPAQSSTSSSTTSSTRSSSTTSTSSSTSSTWTPTPVISLQTVTGQVRTVTVTPTIPPNSQATAGITKANNGGGGLGTGGAVGLTIGLVALVAIISAIIYFCLRKRRKEKEAEQHDTSRRGSSAGFGTAAGAVPSRTMSENSRYVLGTDGRRVVENWETPDASDVRRSRLIPVDQRLDPFSAVYQRGDNKSRESVNTIRDDHDYSRRVASGPGILRATNPDT